MFRPLKLRSSVKKRLKTYKHAPRTLVGQTRQTPKVFSIHQDSYTPKAAAPTTPHATRALQQRHAAAITPARNRRRSGRVERESPRDALRQLSRSMLKSSAQGGKATDTQDFQSWLALLSQSSHRHFPRHHTRQ